MKIHKTSKLFFDKYANKVVISAPLATLFRERDLDQVKPAIDQYFKLLDASPTGYIEFNNRWSSRKYTHQDIFQAYRIYEKLKDEADYNIRIEGSYLGIYSNSEDLIDYFINLDQQRTISITKVESNTSKDFLLANPNVILVKKKTHEYKVKLNALGEGAAAFMEWANRTPGIKIFKKESVYRWNNGVMYVATHKTLTLCKLYLGSKIARIDRLVNVTEI